MKYIIIFAITAAFVVFLLISLTSVFAKRGNEEGKKILEKFEPGNYSPKLTTMVNYHKENGIVEYEI